LGQMAEWAKGERMVQMTAFRRPTEWSKGQSKVEYLVRRSVNWGTEKGRTK
jgi:hypothetical protein